MSRFLQTIDNYTFQKILLTEGRRIDGMNPTHFNWFSNPPETPIVAGQSINFASLGVSPGRVWVVNEIIAHATGKCAIYINVSFGRSANISENGPLTGMLDEGVFQELSGFISSEDGGSVRFTFPQPVIWNEGTQINASYIRDTTTPVGAQLVIQANDLTNDLNFSASKKIAIIGDSTTWSTGGLYTAGKSYWPFLVTSALRETGQNVRLINKSFGGATSIEAAVMVRNGYMDFDYDLLFVSVGMNDSALEGTSEIDFKTSLNKIISISRNRNPSCKIILCGASSTDDPNRTPYIGNYRTYTQQVAQEHSSDNVFYVDLSAAYSASDTSDFTETVTPRIHPNKSGHLKIHNIIYPFIRDNVTF